MTARHPALVAVPDLANRRKALGLRQEDLAERSGISRATIKKIERGQPVMPRSAAAIERALTAPIPTDDCAETDALAVIVAAMQPLDTGGRRRVLAYLTDRFGTGVSESTIEHTYVDG